MKKLLICIEHSKKIELFVKFLYSKLLGSNMYNTINNLNQSPRIIFNNCMAELQFKHDIDKYTCSKTCRYKTRYGIIHDGNEFIILPAPILYRQTHKQCMNCNNSVSDYDLSLCYKCAVRGTVDYDFYHKRCK